ncbi:MAG: hypothetical protein GC202_00700 [Alphaproteobacteria bacterium]|nr:hypothetical protein [Alphaproteobacteria bacterium]
MSGFRPTTRTDVERDARDTKLPLLVVRRNRRTAGLNLVAGSIAFGLAVASVWLAWHEGENILGPLFLLALVAVYGISAGQQFRDESPKVVIERVGLSLPGVGAEPIEWSRIEEIAVTTGLRALGGGRVDVVVDPETYSNLKLGSRWLGDPVTRRQGPRPAFSLIGSALDTPAKTIFAAMHRHWDRKP